MDGADAAGYALLTFVIFILGICMAGTYAQGIDNQIRDVYKMGFDEGYSDGYSIHSDATYEECARYIATSSKRTKTNAEMLGYSNGYVEGYKKYKNECAEEAINKYRR